MSCTASGRFKATHTMVAEDGVQDSGFQRGGTLGTMTPGALNGENIQSLRHSDTGVPNPNLRIEINQDNIGIGNMPQTFWTRLKFRSTDPNWNGVIALSADADTFSNTFLLAASWQFDNLTDDFLDGVTYSLEWF